MSNATATRIGPVTTGDVEDDGWIELVSPPPYRQAQIQLLREQIVVADDDPAGYPRIRTKPFWDV